MWNCGRAWGFGLLFCFVRKKQARSSGKSDRFEKRVSFVKANCANSFSFPIAVFSGRRNDRRLSRSTRKRLSFFRRIRSPGDFLFLRPFFLFHKRKRKNRPAGGSEVQKRKLRQMEPCYENEELRMKNEELWSRFHGLINFSVSSAKEKTARKNVR